jgi:hypothetical protein
MYYRPKPRGCCRFNHLMSSTDYFVIPCRNGTNLSGTQWSPQMLETWLLQQCWPMGYGSYDWRKKGAMKARIAHAIQMVSNWNSVPVPGNSGATMDAEPAVISDDKADRVDPNPPFLPPPLSRSPPTQEQQHATGHGWLPPQPQLQHATTRSGWTSPPPPQPAHHRSRSHDPTPDPEDWEIVPLPHPKSRGHGTPHPKPRLQPQPHVEHFDRSIATMLHTDRGPVIPAGVFAKKNDVPEASSRRKRDKRRSSNLKRDRLSKWFRRGYDSADGGSESDDPDIDSRDRSQHLYPLDLNHHLVPQDAQQPQRRSSPHPSAWHIYAPPASTQSRSFSPSHVELHSHQPPPDMSHIPEAATRRPPPLDLSDTESLSKSLGLLNFRQ